MATATPQLKLSQALIGFINHQTAASLSDHTIAEYRYNFPKLQRFFHQNPYIGAITRGELVTFFAWLRNEYVSVPDGVAPRGEIKLSAKTLLNIHTNLSALWRWAVKEGYAKENIVLSIERPRVNDPVIVPLSREDIEKLIRSTEVSRSWKTRAQTVNKQPLANRNRAIILMLLDTGVRASELCEIKYGDINFANRSIKVFGKGPGKDPKERLVRFGKRSQEALWRHLATRLETIQKDDYVFTKLGTDNEPMNRHLLDDLMDSLSKRANVDGVHAHRFRHTFAINYLRNGGDVFTLQELLGHESLEMVQRYARIAQTDVEKAHQKASPVDNWRL
jgi:integrase/recombinase XerD